MMDQSKAAQTTTRPGRRVPETHPASAITTETEGGRPETTLSRSASQPRPVTGSAVVLTRHGGAEALDVRRWEVPPPGPREVRLRIEAAGVSFADLLICQGLHPEARRTPHVPGWDALGIVESVGEDVEGVTIGERVASLPIVGGWAEYANVPADWLVPVPPTLAPTSAICLVFDYVVAYQMLTRMTAARRGDTVLFQGAGGGVGTAFLQIARELGVRVLGTDKEAKRAHIEAQGGILLDFEHEDIVERCRELTGGRGVDYAFDGVGATARDSLRALRPKGRLVWFGMITFLSQGARDWPKFAKTLANVALPFAENLRPGGRRTSMYSIQTLARRHPDWYRQDLATLFAMLADGKLAPQIAAVLSLDQVPAALTNLAGHGPPGKQVISVTTSDDV